MTSPLLDCSVLSPLFGNNPHSRPWRVDKTDDEDPEEGDTPWWVWLLVVVGVAMVVSRLRGGGARG